MMLNQELERRRFPFDDPGLCFTEESSIDLLAIDSSGEVIANEDCLPHNRLQAELGRLNSSTSSPALQVLFVNTDPDDNCALSLDTANYLCDHLGVSPSFVAGAASRSYGHPEIHHRSTHDPSGGSSKEEGWYSCYISPVKAMAFVWFSYRRGTTTYVVTMCDKDGGNKGVRQRVADHIEGGHAAALLQLLAIDMIIAEVAIHLHREKMRLHRQQLTRSVFSKDALGVKDTGEDVSSQVRELHKLSFRFTTDGALIAATEDTLTCLLGVHEALNPYFAKSISGREYPSATHSLSTLLSETSRLKRILKSEVDRTQTIIDLFRHLSSDAIVQATRRTAIETQKDNTAMITMAALTMLFLPGTFVSGIFSMDFLGPLPGVDASAPGSRWWLYPATTIPLTILVFVIWRVWMSYRVRCNIKSKRGDISQKAQSSAWPILPKWLTTVRPWSRTKRDIESGLGEHPAPAPHAGLEHGDIPQKAPWSILPKWLAAVCPWSRTKRDVESGEHPAPAPHPHAESEHGDIPQKARSSVSSVIQNWLTFVRPWSRIKRDVESGEHPAPVPHPHVPVRHSDPPVPHPHVPVRHSDPPVPHPHGPVRLPDPPVPQPHALVHRPGPPTPHPHAPVPHTSTPVRQYSPVLGPYPPDPHPYPPAPHTSTPIRQYSPVPHTSTPVRQYSPVPKPHALVPHTSTPVPHQYSPVPDPYPPVPRTYLSVSHPSTPVPHPYAPVPHQYSPDLHMYPPVPYPHPEPPVPDPHPYPPVPYSHPPVPYSHPHLPIPDPHPQPPVPYLHPHPPVPYPYPPGSSSAATSSLPRPHPSPVPHPHHAQQTTESYGSYGYY